MIKSDFTRKVGDVTIEVDINSTDTFHVLSMSPIVYEFDLHDDSPDMDSVQVLYNRCKISCRYLTDEGNDLYDLLISEIGFADIDVNVRVASRATSENWLWKFVVNREAISLNETDRLVEIDLRPKIGTGKTYNEFFTDIYNQISPEIRFDPDSADLLAISMGTFIRFVLEDTYGLTPVISAHSDTISKQNGDLVQDDLVFVVGIDEHANVFAEPFDGLIQIAALEGSLFGSGFDRSFWMWKGSVENTVQIGANDVTSLAYSLSFSDFLVVDIGVVGTFYIYGYNKEKFIYGLSNKRLNLRVEPMKAIGTGTFAKGVFDIDDVTEDHTFQLPFTPPDPVQKDIEEPLIDNAVDAYERSVNKPARIKAEVIGIHKIRPWSTITFDNTVNARYQNRNFRPFSLSYDMETDIVTVEAYEVES